MVVIVYNSFMLIIDDELYNDFLDRLLNEGFSKDQSELLASFASISPFTKRWLVKLKLEDVLKEYRTFSFETIKGKIESILLCEDEELFAKKIRHLKYSEIIKIVIRDVIGINSVEKTLEELSLLADLVISACCAYIEKRYKRKTPKISVIAMGKLGAMELNFSSDVDIIYVYESTELDNIEDFNKKAVLINKLLSTNTEDGFLYRVDNDLRPGGRFSPLAMSGEAVKNHYLLFGEAWQRVALLRARFLAGDESFVTEVLTELSPFIYSKYIDYSLVDDLRKLKERINAESLKTDIEGINVKLGKGGIREAEFFVQVLQIINGGKDLSLRKVKFSESVDALANRQIIELWDAKNLKDAYYFLRRVENSIQMEEERQEYLLPKNEKVLIRVIKRCGFDSISEFYDKLEFYRNIVSNHFNKLFEDKIKVKDDGISKENILNNVVKKFGNSSCQIEIVERFFDLREKVQTRYKESFSKFVYELVHRIIEKDNNEKILKQVEDFVVLLVKRPTYIPLLAENPLIIDKVLDILNIGGFLTQILLSHPESLDYFILQKDNIDRKTLNGYLKAVRSVVGGVPDYEDKMFLLRQFKNSEWLKIALLKHSQEIDYELMELFLSNLAEAILITVIQICEDVLNEKYIKPKQDFALIGLGKLGTKEMNFHSDIDLIFVYDSDDEKAAFYNTKLLQRVITALTTTTKEGYLYKVDMRLRPTGSQGPLVTTIENFINYHKENAWIFEKQALTKARVLGENSFFKEKVESILENIVYENDYDEKLLKSEIKAMRKKIETELVTEQKGSFDIKAGRGGIIDIEFIVQYIKLRYGKSYTNLRLTNTEDFFKALKDTRLLMESLVDELSSYYTFLKLLETNIRLYAGYSKDSFRVDELDINVINLVCSEFKLGRNFSSDIVNTKGNVKKSFEKHLKKVLLRVREIFNKVLN